MALVRRVGVSPQVAVGRLAAIPLGAGEEGDPATVLVWKVFLAVAHNVLPPALVTRTVAGTPQDIQHTYTPFLENRVWTVGQGRATESTRNG